MPRKEEIDLPHLLEINVLVCADNRIVGLYTKDEEGDKTLRRVRENMERMHPEIQLRVHTYCTNVPNR